MEGEPSWKLEENKQEAFAQEKSFERKIVICRLEEFRKLNGEQKKETVMLITFPNGARFFV